MKPPGSTFRNILAVTWCALVGAGYLLAQLTAGSTLAASDPEQARLEAFYTLFLVLFALLLIYHGWCAFRGPGQKQTLPN